MEITFIRHAQSMGNVNHSIYYEMMDCDVPLSQKGINDARKLNIGFAHQFKKIYYSPFLRCIQTKNLIFKESSITNQTENPLLIERQWGGLRDIIETKDFDAEKHFNFFYRPPNGESFFDVYQRVIMFFDQLKKNHDEFDKICLITHGEWIRVALMYLDNTTVEDFHKNHIKVKNLDIIVKQF